MRLATSKRRQRSEGDPQGVLIERLHEAFYAPDRAVLARLMRLFGSSTSEVEPPPKLPPFDATPVPRVYLAPEDLQQSILIVGRPGPYAYRAAYTPLMVASEILGAGGFGSRRLTEIRTRRGLAYATGQVSELVLYELSRLRSEGVEPAELERAVTTLVNPSVFRDISVAAASELRCAVSVSGRSLGPCRTGVRSTPARRPTSTRFGPQAGTTTVRPSWQENTSDVTIWPISPRVVLEAGMAGTRPLARTFVPCSDRCRDANYN